MQKAIQPPLAVPDEQHVLKQGKKALHSGSRI